MNPDLRGKAIAVGGRQRGIIASASYPARQRGVYTPMPTAQARKVCPELILVPGRYSLYERFSNKMFDIIRQYTPVVEQCSIDEGYFDLTGRRE
ncbi:MAG: DNA polymerase IV, partial [Verrucomicrobia bacterium]|nr:DNA polymerase IV [Verrucomicrobiota bacterium]